MLFQQNNKWEESCTCPCVCLGVHGRVQDFFCMVGKKSEERAVISWSVSYQVNCKMCSPYQTNTRENSGNSGTLKTVGIGMMHYDIYSMGTKQITKITLVTFLELMLYTVLLTADGNYDAGVGGRGEDKERWIRNNLTKIV